MFNTLEQYLAEQRAANKCRYGAARLLARRKKRSFEQCLYVILLAESRAALVAGLMDDIMAKRGISREAAYVEAQETFEKDRVPQNPERVFGALAKSS